MKAFAAFPFALEVFGNDELDCQSYLRVFGLPERGGSVLSEPVYLLGTGEPKARVHREFRRRDRTEELSFVFQALTDVAPPQGSEQCGTDVSAPSSGRDKEDFDLTDVMAASMKVDLDKYAWRADDSVPAIAQLPPWYSVRRVGWRMHRTTFALLVRVAKAICNARDNDTNERTTIPLTKIEAVPCERFEGAETDSRSVSWPLFSRWIDQNIVVASTLDAQPQPCSAGVKLAKYV